jgi:hypothetical protein
MLAHGMDRLGHVVFVHNVPREDRKYGTPTSASDDATVDADIRYVGSTEEVEATKQAQTDLHIAGGSSRTRNVLRGGIATFLGASYFVLMIPAFVSGLLGWRLVMKKRVLQCGLCGAVVNAS